MYEDDIRRFNTPPNEKIPGRPRFNDDQEDDEDYFFDDISDLDFLFQNVKQYHSSTGYKNLLNFCSRFKELAPFNALMVQIQRPSCKYVLTSKDWYKKYRRCIKEDARPVVILSFMPVSYLFDLSDTEAMEGVPATSDEAILRELAERYKTKNSVSDYNLKTLLDNLATLGIAYEDSLQAGLDYAAHIKLLDKRKAIQVRISKDEKVDYYTPYFINVRHSLPNGAKYAAILHELGHFFCGHLQTEYDKPRSISHATEEFEAESVAWLVCERLNIGNPSEKYLVEYVDENNNIPEDISMEAIFKACNEIWKLLFGSVSLKETFLYRNDSKFRAVVEEYKKNKKQKQSK